MSASTLEKKFALYWRAIRGPQLVAEHRFHPTRKWRFDFAHPASKVAIEVEGGTWGRGRHTRGSGYKADCEKYNAAVADGWAVFRITGDMIATQTLERIAHTISERLRVKEVAA